MAEVHIPASSDPDDLTIAEWQDLDFALGNVSASVHASVMTLARRIKADARRSEIPTSPGRERSDG